MPKKAEMARRRVSSGSKCLKSTAAAPAVKPAVQPSGWEFADSLLEGTGFEPSGWEFADSLLEGTGFEPVWGFSCQVVVSGLWPVFCSEQESRSLSRRLRSGLRRARKGSRDRNASKLRGVPLSGACVSQRLEA